MGIYKLSVVLQAVSVLMLFFTTIYLFTTWKQKTYSNLFLYSLATLINNIGYLVEMTAKTSGEILIGTKFAYLGKVFIPFSLLCFTIQYFNIKMKRRTQYFLAGLHAVIFLLVFTCEYHTLFYTSITYTVDGLFPHNIYGHGIFYHIYTGFLVLYMIAVFAIVIHQRIKSKSRDGEIRTILILACALISMAGFIIFLSGISGGYDTTAIAYMICTFIMMVAVVKYDLLEVLEAVNEYVTDNIYAGLLAVSNDDQIIYRNDPAEKICNALADMKNGTDSTQCDCGIISTASNQILEIIRKKISENDVIKSFDRIYKPRATDLVRRNKKIGKLYILDNITEEYQHAKKIEHMALTDAMTESENRRAYEIKIAELQDKGIPDDMVYISFDVNGLKQVNDNLGHEAGDELIKGAASCIKKCFGKYGSTFRTGGDEFIAIINIGDDEFTSVKDRFATEVKNWKGSKINEMSISAGAVSKREFPGQMILELAKIADKRMYEAKSNFYQSKREGKPEN